MTMHANKQHRSKSEHMLRDYRAAVWQKSILESVHGAGHDEVLACSVRIRTTQELVGHLLNHKLLGEKLYYIIHCSYMTGRKPGRVEEILHSIAKRYGIMPRRTYFRLKKLAFKIMDTKLSETL
jgi:hypothetical protein